MARLPTARTSLVVTAVERAHQNGVERVLRLHGVRRGQQRWSLSMHDAVCAFRAGLYNFSADYQGQRLPMQFADDPPRLQAPTRQGEDVLLRMPVEGELEGVGAAAMPRMVTRAA